MRTLTGFMLVSVAATGLLAQNRSGFVAPRSVTRTLPNVVFPGGGSAMHGVQRTTGSVLFPGGGGPQIGVPGLPVSRSNNVRPIGPPRHNGGGIVAYPVFVGGYDGYYPEAPPAPSEPNVVVVYPPSAPPIIINHYSYSDGQQTISSDRPGTRIFDLPGRQQQAAVEEPRTEADQFLIAFQDKSIYSAIAYWVDGDTLHYFTAGNTHNQASVALVDRELTAKLNKESGREVKLPALK